MDNRETQTCIKVVIFISSLVSTVIALVSISYGIIFLINIPYDDVKLWKTMKIFASGNITIGVILLILSIVGFFSSILNNKILLIVFAVFGMVTALIMFAFGVYLVVKSAQSYDGKSKKDLAKMLLHKYGKYILGGKPEDKKFIDDFHSYYKCCGPDGPDDWKSFLGEVPSSCYTAGWLHRDGCTDAFTIHSPVLLAFGILSLIDGLFKFAVGILAVYFAKIIQPERPFHDNPIGYNTAPQMGPIYPIYPRGQYQY